MMSSPTTKRKSTSNRKTLITDHSSSTPRPASEQRNGSTFDARTLESPSRKPAHLYKLWTGVMHICSHKFKPKQVKTRDLREKCREHTAKESPIWERKVASGNVSGAALAPSAQMSGDSMAVHKTQSLH
ncbi:hypothetical protein OS493_019853 [Desmophyllum pertusum]|uniref:Uncharacterized protein n=1 Tax=Desmophyllum pertusum TaxID=174260 RepID=A0A9X0CR48_9CNID|nr:hypothetical protein OS493_019853 [Desmophyllum pertusum]